MSEPDDIPQDDDGPMPVPDVDPDDGLEIGEDETVPDDDDDDGAGEESDSGSPVG